MTLQTHELADTIYILISIDRKYEPIQPQTRLSAMRTLSVSTTIFKESSTCQCSDSNKVVQPHGNMWNQMIMELENTACREFMVLFCGAS